VVEKPQIQDNRESDLEDHRVNAGGGCAAKIISSKFDYFDSNRT
jgi:hypothetical protein